MDIASIHWLLIAYSCPPITVVNVEHFAVEDHIDAKIEILPVPEIAEIILW